MIGVRVYTRHMSDNPTSADNQQERLLQLSENELGSYLAGFADGEGSFNISFRKRSDYKEPWKISACFNISQKEKPILELCQRTFHCGTLRSRPDGIWYFEVNNLRDLQRYIIPFFTRFGFLSVKKQRDFDIFCELVKVLSHPSHRCEDIVRLILDLRRDMNDGGKRKYSETQILAAFAKESSETTRQTPEAISEMI